MSASGSSSQFRAVATHHPSHTSLQVVGYEKKGLLRRMKPVSEMEMIRSHDQYDNEPMTELDGQTAMFGVKRHASPWTVVSMAARKGSESHVSPLLGLSAQVAVQTSGTLPRPSNNLSDNSGRLVDKLADAGVVEDRRDGYDESNGIKRREARGMAKDAHKEVGLGNRKRAAAATLPQSDVDLASRTTRSILKASRKKRPEGVQEGLW